MKGYAMFMVGALVGVGAMFLPRLAAHVHAAHAQSGGSNGMTLAHTEERFEFTARGAMDVVGPLFGADKERVWAPGWNPNFVWPASAADQRGMVFRVDHGDLHAAWINTQFDLKNGNVQYAYVIPNALATLITIKLEPLGNETHISVLYERTALSADANGHVQHLAEQDRKAGAEWEDQINKYLRGPLALK
jgi:hypothetical protein